MPKSPGYSLIEVLVVIAITAIAISVTASMMSWQSRTNSIISLRSNLLIMKQNFLATLANPTAWEITKQKNQSTACLLNRNCVNGQGGPLALYDASGNLLYDSVNPAYGLATNGQPCKAYSPAGNPQCPMRINLTWQAQCSTPAHCQTPNELVSMQFTVVRGQNTDYFTGLENLNVVNNYRLNLTPSTPVVICARSGGFFIGIGSSFNGYTADANGCVPLTAFQGPAGSAGP